MSADEFDERLSRLEQVVKKQSENINKLAVRVDSAIVEMREGFNKLIAANELTNSLIEKLRYLEEKRS